MNVNATIFPFVLSIFAILDLVVHAKRHCVCDALSLSSSAPQNLNDSLRHWPLYLGGLSSQEVAKLLSISLDNVSPYSCLFIFKITMMRKKCLQSMRFRRYLTIHRAPSATVQTGYRHGRWNCGLAPGKFWEIREAGRSA
jgi:hypothetical protein